MRRRTRKSVRWHDDEFDREATAPQERPFPAADPPAEVPVKKSDVTFDPALSPIFYTPRSSGRLLTPFRAAMLFSVVFHLSMVTLFNIVIYFPRQDLSYFDVKIVQVRPMPAGKTSESAATETPRLQDPLREGLGLKDQAALEKLTSSIELPTLEFAELNRLRVRQETLNNPSAYSDLFNEGPKDSWAQFGAGIKHLRQTLTDLAFSSSDRDGGGKRAEAAELFHPAQGFDAHIEWSGEPKNRKLLFAPPIDALWEIDPATMKKPIELVLKVDAHGRVINVWSPAVDTSGLIDQVQMAVLKYRFEPLELEGQEEQIGTLHIQAAGNAP